jgi:hypothetical protein
MLNFIKKVLITYKLNKINNRLMKERLVALNAQNTREMDLAMTKLGEIVTDYFINYNMSSLTRCLRIAN